MAQPPVARDGMTMRRWTGVGLVAVLALALAAVVFAPLRTVAVLAGLERGKADEIHYLRGGEGVPVVLVHGIFDRKESLVHIARKLSGHYDVLVPDLPGFGENEPIDAAEFALARQAERVMEWVNGQGLQRFHIAGTSMGGAIAATVAARFPDRVLSLGFIGAPLGVPGASAEDDARAVLIADDGEADRLSLVAPNAPFYIRWLQTLSASVTIRPQAQNTEVWNVVTEGNEDLLARLSFPPDLKVFALWCRDDAVFPVSGAQWLQADFTEPDVLVRDDCGHAPALAASMMLGSAYLWSLAHIDAGKWPPYGRPTP